MIVVIHSQLYLYVFRLFGDYESLDAGRPKDALVDMLGGLGQVEDLSEHKGTEEKESKLFENMLEAYENHSVMTASISVSFCYYNLLPI